MRRRLVDPHRPILTWGERLVGFLLSIGWRR